MSNDAVQEPLLHFCLHRVKLNGPEYGKSAYNHNGKPGSMSLFDALRLYFRIIAAEKGTVYGPLGFLTPPYLMPLVRLVANAYPDKQLARHKEVSVATVSHAMCTVWACWLLGLYSVWPPSGQGAGRCVFCVRSVNGCAVLMCGQRYGFAAVCISTEVPCRRRVPE